MYRKNFRTMGEQSKPSGYGASKYGSYQGNKFGKREAPVAEEIEEEDNLAQSKEFQIFELVNREVNFLRTGYLANVKTVTVKDDDDILRTMLLGIFVDQRGEWFTALIKHSPYFLVKPAPDSEDDLVAFLSKRFESKLSGVEIVDKLDLETLNHLSGITARYIKLSFHTEADKSRAAAELQRPGLRKREQDILSKILELREYDLFYDARVMIDRKIRVSFWYNVTVMKGFAHKIELREGMLEKPAVSVLAYDIETSKAPLKFPDPSIDVVMLISYVIDGETFLIVNREMVGADVQEFFYCPKKDIEAQVTVYNEPNELACLVKFFQHIKLTKPLVITSFNGDMFDFPFIAERTRRHGLSLEDELGICESRGQFYGKLIFIHADCLYWVQRDAFLPHGSHGLKAVTRAKLGYDPIEVDPEQMVRMAEEEPQKMAQYSVSDAVATYHIYMKYIHDFLFALCSIIPLSPDDVLRRGSGTLNEHLLMAEATKQNIVFPNKKRGLEEKFYNGHLIESETYVGGFVECLATGVYRADVNNEFTLKPETFDFLIEKADDILRFYLETELGKKYEDLANSAEVRESVISKLTALKDKGRKVISNPLIYHVDVASMYPNIILTNRLQPTAIVDERICSNCIFNESKNNCKRPLGWEWKAQYYPLKRAELEKLKLEFSGIELKPAIKKHCQREYKSVHTNVVEQKENTVCMRENPFYVDTIREFRDRRNKYKADTKMYLKKHDEFFKAGILDKAAEARVMAGLCDSRQLAHKIILNSFYGYVMKKGARWYSMEMAAMVTFVGSKIIQEAKELIVGCGMPLEIDTDGIWTLFPAGFPENFSLKFTNGSSGNFSFPCIMLNWLIYEKFKNDQYQTLVNPDTLQYSTRTEMTIFFEIDGPYQAMIIPAAREEGKKLKKRYVVFGKEGVIKELKGFEIKRRGELGIIKAFQEEIFKEFLKGTTLSEIYSACADSARKWVRIILDKGAGLSDEYLIELLGEMKVLSRAVEDYGEQKGIALTTAKRLVELQGEQSLKGKGINCQFIICHLPKGKPLNERAIPISVFYYPDKMRNKFLQKWTGYSDTSKETLITLLDWDYYLDRLTNTIQKIVLIPAILQNKINPLPELKVPDWIEKQNKKQNSKQLGLENFFSKQPKTFADIEALAEKNLTRAPLSKPPAPKASQKGLEVEMEIEGDLDRENLEQTQHSLHLTLLKKKWREERRRKKALTLTDIQIENGDLQLFAKRLEARIKSAPWHLVRVEKTQTPGLIKLWVVIDGMHMVSKQIQSYRRIFVNSKVEDHTGSRKLVKRHLPREKPAHFLYEFVTDEESFQKSFKNLDDFLIDPSIEGVYESQIPLKFQLVLQAGSYFSIPNSVAEVDSDVLNFEQLTESPAIFGQTIFGETFKVLYIWHLSFLSKSLFCLFSEKSVSILKCQPKERDRWSKADCRALVHTKLKALQAEGKLPHVNIEQFDVSYHNFTTSETLSQQIFKSIMEFKERLHMGAFVVVLQGSKLFGSELAASIRSEMPLLEIAQIHCNQLQFSSLNWETAFLDRAIADFSELETVVLETDQLSAYIKSPICNMRTTLAESALYAIDLLFARELASQRYLLWYGKGQADVGCKPGLPDHEEILNSMSEICEINRPGVFSTWTYEISIDKFHFNAIVLNHLLDAFWARQTIVGQLNGRQGNSAKELQRPKMAFKVLGELALKLYGDYYNKQLWQSGFLLENLVRWLFSPQSRMTDTYLQQIFSRITKQFFDNMVKLIEEMGGAIVYASPFKIIVNSKKNSDETGRSFVEFVLKTLTQDHSFAYISTTIKQGFQTLFFRDSFNYACVLNRDQGIALNSIWRNSRFLPSKCQGYFFNFVNSYFGEYWKLRDANPRSNEKFLQEFTTYVQSDFLQNLLELLSFISEQYRLYQVELYNQSKQNNQPATAQLSAAKAEQSEEESQYDDRNEEDYVSNDEYEDDSFLEDDLEPVQKKLKKKAAEILVTQSVHEDVPDKIESWSFPESVGQAYRATNVALEFVKLVFSILMSDSIEVNQVLKSARSQCLRYVHVDEYSKESEAKPLFFKFIVCDMNCESCFNVKNIDIFQEFDEDQKTWLCHCGAQYSKSAMENAILRLLQGLRSKLACSLTYCTHCNMIKDDLLSNRCGCGGIYSRELEWFEKEYAAEQKNGFRNFKQLAYLAGLKTVEDYFEAF